MEPCITVSTRQYYVVIKLKCNYSRITIFPAIFCITERAPEEHKAQKKLFIRC